MKHYFKRICDLSTYLLEIKKFIFAFFVAITFFGCKAIEPINATKNYTGKRYAFGKTIGLNRISSEFILSENGQVHKYDFNYDREVFFKNLPKMELLYFLEKVESLSLEGIEMNEPGNTSYYIDIKIGKTSINKIIWGNYKFNPDQELIDFHKEILQKISTWD